MGATEEKDKAQPEPQPDRTVLVPLLNEIEQLRLDLTTAASWLFGHWPPGMRPPEWATPRIDGTGVLRLTGYVSLAADLLAVRTVLEADGGTVVRREHGDGSVWVRVERRFGLVTVEAFTAADVWDRVFPEVVRTARAVQGSKADQ